jgi:hypothetical protein
LPFGHAPPPCSAVAGISHPATITGHGTPGYFRPFHPCQGGSHSP